MESKAIVLILIALSLIGILAVYSVDPLRGEKWGESCLVDKLSGTGGWVAFIFSSQIDYHKWVKRGWLWYFLMILSLGAVLVWEEEMKLVLGDGFFLNQCSLLKEAKVLLVLFLAYYFSEQREKFRFLASSL
jgi:cell division protein FtsW (lipid II flippase)